MGERRYHRGKATSPSLAFNRTRASGVTVGVLQEKRLIGMKRPSITRSHDWQRQGKLTGHCGYFYRRGLQGKIVKSDRCPTDFNRLQDRPTGLNSKNFRLFRLLNLSTCSLGMLWTRHTPFSWSSDAREINPFAHNDEHELMKPQARAEIERK